MKLYLLTRNDSTLHRYDITLGYVIAAENEKEAIEISNVGAYDWVDDEKMIDIQEIGEANSDIEKGIILEDYRAG